jgi:methanethiol S-methyltransferase
LRQVIASWRSQQSDAGLRATMLYRVVRHPLMLGFLVALWCAPTMTAGHLLFASVTTGYILVALQLEERDLLATLGARYATYRQTLPMLIPRPRRRDAPSTQLAAAEQ